MNWRVYNETIVASGGLRGSSRGPLNPLQLLLADWEESALTLQEWSLHAAEAVSMAPRIVSILQIVGFLCSLASAQLDDLKTAYDFSGSGNIPSDPTLVDLEPGAGDDGDYEYIFPFVPEDVDICRGYPLGI